ncbi:RdgB/HAM1 family non-canonical purine NTP pyrophosphatase [Acidiplasma sp.]|uniref:RdgB/HAM1 family non-canonical purine NTP pyrophosphatase n=1 Tax=Acidiplasma sp. TaxID=1872114 RepID=UPI002585881D|nr:RdgB/HAM1 family non-canonical purine NTP pyrophosphatase [Acidiplasma sp.]
MIYFVTHNKNKYIEAYKEFKENGIDISWIETEYPEVQGNDNEFISRWSCESLVGQVNEPFFIDDTGLYIENLNGFPGPYASYVHDTLGNSLIVRLASGSRAYFKTVISFYYKNNIYQFSGILKGIIADVEHGGHAFGYDPIFVPENSNKTLSELSIEEKNKISHRGKAIKKFMAFLKDNSIV